MFKALTGVAALAAILWSGMASAYPYVYVPEAGAGKVTVLDAQTNTIVRTIPNVSNALSVAVNPDGSRAYISNGTAGTVTVFDTTLISNTNQNPIIGHYDGLGNVISLAVGPKGKELYVADAAKDQAIGIDMAASTYQGPYAAASSGLTAMALAPSGRALALASGSGSSFTVRIYDLTNGSYKDVTLSSQPESLLFSSDGNKLWIATAQGFDTYDLGNGSQSTTAVSGGVGAMAYSPRAGVLYVASLSNPDIYAYPAAAGSPTTITLSATPTGLALSPDGTRLYAPRSGGLTVIDTGTDQVATSVAFGTSPAAVGNFVGPGDIWADNSTANTNVGQQLSYHVAGNDYQNRVLSYDVISQPSRGTLNFTQSTGDYTYTPPSSTYSGIQTMVWEAKAGGGTGSPTAPVSRPITTTILVHPGMTRFSDQQVDAGTTLGPFSFTLTGSTPFSVNVTSSNKTVVDPASAVVSPGCGTTTLSCTLTLTAGNNKGAGSVVTVTATDPSGLTATQSFRVSINGGTSGGGGGSLPWPVLVVLATLFLMVRTYRRTHGKESL